MTERPFAPAWGKASVVANATSATAAVVLPESCEQVALYNTSSAALTIVYVTQYSGAAPTGIAPTATSGMPVPPGQMIRLTVGAGKKVIRTIASAADGNIWIVPGNGD